VITVDRSVYADGAPLASAVEALASAEGLDAHAESIRLRQRAVQESPGAQDATGAQDGAG
jgi:histidinol dehydrogenase